MVATSQLHGTVLQTVPQLQQLPGTPIGNLLVALVALAVVVFVGRFVLGVAWKLVRVGIVVVGVLWVASVAAPGLL